MNGFVVVAVTEKSEALEYWNGNGFVGDIRDAEFYFDRTQARMVAGTAQTAHTDKDVKIHKATKTVVLDA